MPQSQVKNILQNDLGRGIFSEIFRTKQGTFWYEWKPSGEKKRRYFIREQSHYVANDMRKYIESFIESRRFNGEKKPNNIDGIN